MLIILTCLSSVPVQRLQLKATNEQKCCKSNQPLSEARRAMSSWTRWKKNGYPWIPYPTSIVLQSTNLQATLNTYSRSVLLATAVCLLSDVPTDIIFISIGPVHDIHSVQLQSLARSTQILHLHCHQQNTSPSLYLYRSISQVQAMYCEAQGDFWPCFQLLYRFSHTPFTVA